MSDGLRRRLRKALSIDAAWLAMPLFVVAIRTLLQPIPMEDYWWHLVMGRSIDVTGQIPDTNLFLFTLPTDAPFYNQSWLGAWLMYRLQELGGHRGVVVAHVLLAVTAWGLLVRAARNRGVSPVVTGICASVAYYISASTLMPRTQMFVYPIFVVVVTGLLSLIQADERQAWTTPTVLVVCTIIWANVHGTFVLAPVLGIAALGTSAFVRRGDVPWKLPALTGIALLAAPIVSPGLVENLTYPFKILVATKSSETAVAEWVAADPLSLTGGVFYLALLGCGYVLWRRRRDVELAEVAMLVPLTAIAVTSVRGILWWSLAAVLIVGPHVTALRGAADREIPSGREATFNFALLAGLLVAVLCALPGGPVFNAVDPAAIFGDGRLTPSGDRSVLSELHPVGLVGPIRDLEPRRVFHHQSVGGFFEWALTSPSAPGPQLFVDQRLELIEPRIWREYFIISDAADGWKSLVEAYEIDVFVLRTDEQSGLDEALGASERHELVQVDRGWHLYARKP